MGNGGVCRGQKKRQTDSDWRFFMIILKLPTELQLNEHKEYGRGGWIRTNAWQDQNLLPYRLATPLYLRLKAP